MIRDSVRRLLDLGPIPGEKDEVSPIEDWEAALQQITKPIANEEAEALTLIFPPDLAFGLGHTLLHIVETAPGWGPALASKITEREWRERATQRLHNSAP